MTHSEAEIAYNNSEYKTFSDEQLKEAADVCMNVGGANLIAVDRIRRVGELLREELKHREDRDSGQPSFPSVLMANSTESSPADIEGADVWTEDKLRRMIADGIEEGVELEYKAAAALGRQNRERDGITKDVSAMANSTGGVLIYGVAEFQDKERQHLPEKIDPVDRTQYSREWLDQVCGTIRPRIPNLRITPVQLNQSASSAAYVVEVPQGQTAHQANDCRYYRRYNFECVPMLDHEIRDVMNRRGHPRLKISAELVFFKGLDKDGRHGNLIVEIENDSDVFARYVALLIETPLSFHGKKIIFDDATFLNEPEVGWQLRYSNHARAPLFPRVKLKSFFRFRRGEVTSRDVADREISVIRYVAYADSMQPIRGQIDPEQLIGLNL